MIFLSAYILDSLGTAPMLALGCIVFSLVYIIRQASARPPRPTYSLHPWLPSFISGMYAAITLGTDETNFLMDLKKRYGDVVYMPFPLSKHFVFDNEIVKKIFEGKYNKQLSFTPFRLEASNLLFNTSKKVLADPRTPKHIFPVMSKGLMSNTLLQPALGRFASEVERRLDALGASSQSAENVDLVSWSFDTVFESAKIALFGYRCPDDNGIIKSSFLEFDNVFPLLASGFLPPFLQYRLPATKAGVLARDRLNKLFGTWARDTGCEGLEKGDVMFDMIQEAFGHLDQDGKPLWGVNDLGSALTGDIWALEANSTHAACWVVLYCTQAGPELKEKLLREVDAISFSPRIGAEETPLLTSIIYETLRLHISAYSVRRSISADTFALGQTTIRPKEEVLIIQRAINLDETIWGENVRIWDPTRFYDAPGSGTNKAARVHEVRAFGGGSSKCEGRVLAIAELRIFLVGLLKKFDIQLRESAASICKDRVPCLTLQNEIVTAILPGVKPGRPGAGAYQILGKVPVIVKPRRSLWA